MAHRALIIVSIFTLGGAVAALMITRDYYEADKMAFDGQVQGIERQSQNHGLPLVYLRTPSGVKQLQNFRLEISSALKIGDRFSKKAGSHECDINGIPYVCVN